MKTETKKTIRARFANMSVRARLYAVAAFLAIPIVGLSGIVLTKEFAKVQRLSIEVETVQYIGPTAKLMSLVAVRRGLLGLYLSDTTGSTEKLDAATKKIDELVATLDSLTELYGAQLKTADNWKQVKEAWVAMRARGTQVSRDDVRKYSATMTGLLEQNLHLAGDNGKLLDDDDSATVNLAMSTIFDLSDMIRQQGPLAGLALDVSKKQGAFEADRGSLKVYIQEVQKSSHRFDTGMGDAAELRPVLQKTLNPVVKTADENRNELFDLLQNKILADVEVSGPQIYSLALRSIESNDAAAAEAIKSMDWLVRSNRTDSIISGSILLTVVVVALLFAGIALVFIVRSIINPLNDAVTRTRDIAEGEGDLTKRLTVRSEDEVGELGTWMNTFIGNIEGIIGGIFNISSTLTGSSSALAETSQSLSAGSEQVSQQSQAIAASATQMNQNMHVLSSAAEELAISVNEVARRASEAATVAGDANRSAGETDTIVRELGESASEIGAVVEAIASIAAQTNLLALNAAIEAAGAGEAGKGFAVVATEVKELARQTADSSGEIKKKVAAIQGSIGRAVDAIGSIRLVIQKVNDITTAIASSVEEQSITGREMAANVSQASSASNEVAKNIAGISTATRSGAENAEKTAGLAGDLNRMAVDLSKIVNKFKFSRTTGTAAAAEHAA